MGRRSLSKPCVSARSAVLQGGISIGRAVNVNEAMMSDWDWVQYWTAAYVVIAVTVALYEVAARDKHGFLASVIGGSFLVPPFGRVLSWW